MSDAFAQFEDRLEKLERKHRGLSNGYVASIDADGLISVLPKEKQTHLPVRLFLTVAGAVLLLKSVALVFVAQATYQDRVQALATGSWFEKVCAWIMQVDPVSRLISDFLIGIFA